IFVEKTIEGKQTKEILPEFKDIINSLHFQQTMRWGELSYKFARPIRWLVALADEEVIPFEIAEVKTDRETRGHRFRSEEHTYELQSRFDLVCRLLLEKKNIYHQVKYLLQRHSSQ